MNDAQSTLLFLGFLSALIGLNVYFMIQNINSPLVVLNSGSVMFMFLGALFVISKDVKP